MIEPTSGSGAKAIARETPSAFDTPDPVPGAAARPVLALSDTAGGTAGGDVSSSVLCTRPAQTPADAGVAQTGRATRGDGPPTDISGVSTSRQPYSPWVGTAVGADNAASQSTVGADDPVTRINQVVAAAEGTAMAMGLTGNAADIANRLVAASRSLHSAADGPAAGATDDPRHRAPEMSGSMPPGLYMSATDAVRAGDDLMGPNLTTGTPEPALPAVSHGTGPVPVMDVGSAPVDDGMARERAALASARRPCAAADPATPLGLAQLLAGAQCTIAFPWGIGCGIAGGFWPAYSQLIDDFARAVPQASVVLVELCPPSGGAVSPQTLAQRAALQPAVSKYQGPPVEGLSLIHI